MTEDDLDPVFKALASSHRRKLLDLLRDGALTTSDLVAAFPELSRYAVMQHLDVLESAGLVVVERRGRHRYNHLNPTPIQQVHDRWIGQYAGHWTGALTALKRSLEDENRPPDERVRPLRRSTRR
jgi:DNA-binding transcriptional ArsR family regulator